MRHEVQALAGPISSGRASLFSSPTQNGGSGAAFDSCSPEEERQHGRQTGLAALARICNAGRLAPATSHDFAQAGTPLAA